MNFLTVSAVLYVLLLWGAYKMLTSENQMAKKSGRTNTVIFAALVVMVTAFKVWLSQTFFGHSSDMSLFCAWADLGRYEPVSEFYGSLGAEYFVDYPPLYLYVLTAVGKLAELFHISFGSDAYIVLIKFVPVMADTVSALVVYKLAFDEFGKKTAGILSLLVLFNPAYVLNSVFWGQIDGLYTLIILWLIFSVYRKRYDQTIVAFTVGMLTKPQMIIFLPLLGFWLIYDAVSELKEEKRFVSLKKFLLGILVSAAIAVAAIVPIFGLDFGRFFVLYKEAAAQYPYATLNAANLFGAFGLNWADTADTFLGITYQSWGFIGIILTSLAVGLGTFFAQNRSGVLILGGFNVLSIFMLAHTMHERYMFPLILILLVIYIYTKDKRMLFAFGAATILSFVQTGIVLLDNEEIISFSEQSFIALSWVHVLFFGYMLAVWYKMLIHDDVKLPEMRMPKIICIEKDEEKVRCTKKDLIIVAVLTLVYGVSAFAHLGSINAPETGFRPNDAGETIILDFGEEKEFDRVNFFLGWIGRRDLDSEVERVLSVSFGIDPAEEEESADLIFGDTTELIVDSVFNWNGFFAGELGRYMKITVDEGNFFINEITCFDPGQNLISPVAAISENPTANLMFDEQDKAVYEYTWYDGTYFDEVYHPRTAYEYMNGIWPYENTHPPLGKLIIALGMMIFGVNPFGWRFFGTLCGVLMVPISFALGKQILKDTKWAFVAAFLFTFDFMHLSQTRLATIDSFTALFAMLMYYFMYQYSKLNFYNAGVKKTLLPLALSGLFFGIGVATKWQGVYAGIGLCVLFFWTLFKRFSEFKAAKEGRLVGDADKIIKQFVPNLVKTLAAAVVFFVIVPFVIYFLSYLPIILSDTADISYFWENQETMLSYHSQLTETHPYGSPWWSWPLDMRPLYAYNPNWDFVPETQAQGISSFGNPLVWWLTIPSLGFLVYMAVKGKRNAEIYTVLVGFGALYFPWMLISRQAFIYHFFPCVIFVALAISYGLRELLERHPEAKIPIRVYLACVLVLFIAFYPVLTGMRIPAWYADALTWFPGWVLG